MGSAVLAHRDTAVGSADLHIQVGVAHGVADLLKSATCSKHGKAGCKGHQASGGHTGSHTDHIGLSDTAVEVAVGESLLEGAGLGSACQVSIQNYQVIMLCAQLSQSCAIAIAGSDFLHISHITLPPVLRTVPSAQSLPARTQQHWEPCRASRHRFP